MKSKRYLIGGVLIVLLAFIINYERYTDISPGADEIKQYEELNKILNTKGQIGFIDSASKILDSSLSGKFQRLRLQGKLLSIERTDKPWIIYTIKHEKVRPILGIGLNYFSHYLIYSENNENDFEKFFEGDYGEEKYIKSEKVKDKWFYVVGEHYSD